MKKIHSLSLKSHIQNKYTCLANFASPSSFPSFNCNSPGIYVKMWIEYHSLSQLLYSRHGTYIRR